MHSQTERFTESQITLTVERRRRGTVFNSGKGSPSQTGEEVWQDVKVQRVDL